MPKCCYYERGKERKTICTTDQNCPPLGEGDWKRIGEWNVENCHDCFESCEEKSKREGRE